jgi:16S rRNA (cytidine1402-2'-O)-methyltransferase
VIAAHIVFYERLSYNMNGKLYIVATPIGNLGDMTPRAVEILREADIIAAEDTQTSMTLLTKFEIKTKLISNHKFNETNSADYFINELLNGKNIALISDAGTPCISDPGSVLVKRASENNIEVVSIPGACAAAAAVSISGFDIKSFVFEGFFPRDNTEIKKIIKKLTDNPGVYIFYESPKRIIKTIRYFAENLPEASICLCNDLTKKFEKIYRGSPVDVLENLRVNPSAEKGEYTIVIETVGDGAIAEQSSAHVPPNENSSIEAIIVDVMIKQKCTVKDAVKYIASDSAYELSKNEVYAASLNLKKMFGDN